MSSEVELGDVCEITMGQAPAGETYNNEKRGLPLIAGAGDFGEAERPKAKRYTSAPTKICKSGDIVLSIRATIGTKVLSDQSYCLGRGVAGLRAKSKLNARYLWHWLTHAEPALSHKGRGATFPQVSRRDIAELYIPLPSLDEQRRIAAILDRADALRRKRQRIAELLRNAPQSLFMQMFGDPKTNPGRWNRASALSDVATIGSGITKGRKEPSTPVRAVPYLAVANVQDRSLDLSAVKTIEASEEEICRFRLKGGDLVLTEGGDPDKLGRGTVWRDELPEAIHQNHIFRVRVDPSELDPLYLNFLVSSQYGKEYFLRSAKQTTGIASINKAQLSRFPVFLPPLDLQKRFAIEIDRLRAAKDRTVEADLGMANLFTSLQHRAFSGKL